MSRTGDLADHKRLGANRISKFRMVALRWIFARPLLVQQLHSENVRRPQISARAKEQYCSARDQGETICSGCYSSNSASIAGVRRLRGETQKLGNHCIRTAGGSAYGRPIRARSGPERDLARARTRVRSSFRLRASRKLSTTLQGSALGLAGKNRLVAAGAEHGGAMRASNG